MPGVPGNSKEAFWTAAEGGGVEEETRLESHMVSHDMACDKWQIYILRPSGPKQHEVTSEFPLFFLHMQNPRKSYYLYNKYTLSLTISVFITKTVIAPCFGNARKVLT